MPQRFYNISSREMAAVLLPMGFNRVNIQGTVELVYEKPIRRGAHNLILRVYTAIWPSGESRDSGEDAIRVQVHMLYEGEDMMIGKSRVVKRIESWAANLTVAIDEQDANCLKVCPACGYPMVMRNGKYGEFWGCVTYKYTKCSGKASATVATPAKPVAVSPPVVATPPRKPPTREEIAAVAPAGGSLWDRLMRTQQDRERLAELSDKLPTPTMKDSVIVKPPSVRKPVVGSDPKRTDASFVTDGRWEFPGDPLNVFRIEPWKISDPQQEAERLFRKSQRNLMLPSRAGGGKTTMLKHLASFRNEPQRFTYQAYNSKNAAKARKDFPRGTFSMTTHSHLLRVLRDNIRGMPERATDNKNWVVMEKVYPSMGKKERKRIRKAAFELLGLSKNYAIRPGDMAGISSVMEMYTFDLSNDHEIMTTIEVVNECMELSRPGAEFGSIFDCDDMLWWWVIMDLPPQYFNVALLDEVQDFNECQLEMVRRMLDKGMRIIAVGDPYQSCYLFRGANAKAYTKLGEILAADKRGCDTVLLPINYRSGKVIIDFVRENTICKDIVAAPDAIEGEVRTDLCYDAILDMLAEEHASTAA